MSIGFLLLSIFEVLNSLRDTSSTLARVTSLLKKLPEGLAQRSVRFLTNESGTLLVLSVLALVVTGLMALHHHKLAKRVEEHQRFLGSLRGLTEEAVRLSISSNPSSGVPFIEQRALQTLTDWRTPQNALEKPKFAATLLETPDEGQTFTLICQWPPNTYNFHPAGLKSPCAAQKTVSFERLIYVPRTRFSHGAQLQWSTTHATFTNTELAEEAFVILPTTFYKHFHPKSTICFMIPADKSKPTRYVICLDSARGNPFKLVDFEAVHMIGSVVAQVVNDVRRHTGSATLVLTQAATP